MLHQYKWKKLYPIKNSVYFYVKYTRNFVLMLTNPIHVLVSSENILNEGTNLTANPRTILKFKLTFFIKKPIERKKYLPLMEKKPGITPNLKQS